MNCLWKSLRRFCAIPELNGWDGFGIVVQAYGKAAPRVIDFLYELATELDRKIMIRLVKGAYWDTEIKRAQVEGIEDFPVYTRKAATDIAYMCCAKKLLGMTDRIYPQFAGHNAHSVSAILRLADTEQIFEFQRIHGMGESLHSIVRKRENIRCRIYAPVGEHGELLPYLARRMLENGANSSFVNQIADMSRGNADVAACPFESLTKARESNVSAVVSPSEIFGSERQNSRGWDLHDPGQVAAIEEARAPHRATFWDLSTKADLDDAASTLATIANPSKPVEIVGSIREISASDVDRMLANAHDWSRATAPERARVLNRASDIYEDRAEVFFALLCREAGKSLADATAELREAVDFLRYYALEGQKIGGRPPLGLVACVSPWELSACDFYRSGRRSAFGGQRRSCKARAANSARRAVRRKLPS